MVSCFIKAVNDPETIGKAYELEGPEILILEDIDRRTLSALGSKRKMFRFPMPVVNLAVIAMEKLFPQPPVTRSLLKLLRVSNVCTDNRVYQFVPTP